MDRPTGFSVATVTSNSINFPYLAGPRDVPTPSVQTFSAMAQGDIGSGFVLDIAYAGKLGRQRSGSNDWRRLRGTEPPQRGRTPAANTLGAYSHNPFRGPDVFTYNATLFRDFAMGENMSWNSAGRCTTAQSNHAWLRDFSRDDERHGRTSASLRSKRAVLDVTPDFFGRPARVQTPSRVPFLRGCSSALPVLPSRFGVFLSRRTNLQITKGQLSIVRHPSIQFQSFWQAGFECSTHTLRSGKRLDLLESTGHAKFADQDYARLKNLGISTVREGLRWHLIESSPGKYDFSSAQVILEAAQRQGIQVIWDLVHFGWPDFLDPFQPLWPESLACMAANFGRVLASEMSDPAIVAPVNEISFVSWAGGDTAYLNPFARGRGAELKRQLVRGVLVSTDALRAELPGVRLVAPEPVIHIVGDPAVPGDVVEAAQYRSAMFEAWDMIAGRAQPELGGRDEYLDVIGINYYDRNQWWNHGKTIFRQDPHYRPFREILLEVRDRYERPIFIAETGTENEDRPHWLAYIAEEVRAANRSGAGVQGICLYPILNHPGWDDDRHCYNGLFDYAGADGEREIYKPLAEELERQKYHGGTL